jgi:gamma-glutamylcyclotransferase (GGCT)/AIG2-like uncharacterized protein YtfP
MRTSSSPASGVFLLFVYGTLLSGEENYALLAGARFEGVARTAAGYALADLGAYPGLVAEGAGSVAGELYAVDAATLAALDRLEDVPRLYVRIAIALAEDGTAETYLYARDVGAAPRIPGGDWRRRAEASG